MSDVENMGLRRVYTVAAIKPASEIFGPRAMAFAARGRGVWGSAGARGCRHGRSVGGLLSTHKSPNFPLVSLFTELF